MGKEAIVRFAANGIAAMLQYNVEVGWLSVDSDGKVTLPLQPVGLASVRFHLGFTMRCPICWTGLIQPVEVKKTHLTFLQNLLSDSRTRKLAGSHCESRSCVLHKQIVPKAMVMEIASTKSATTESRLLALLEWTSKVGSIDDTKGTLRHALDLSMGTKYQSIIQDMCAEASRIAPPVARDQWRRLDELVDSAAHAIVQASLAELHSS